MLRLLFVVSVVATTAAMVILVVPQLPGMLGAKPDGPIDTWQALASIGLALPLVFAALYAGGLAWLVLACLLFPRDEVETFLKHGPTTRLEIRILERFGR